MINIAKNKPCFQSSLSKWSKDYHAKGVVIDFEKEEEFGFHTNLEDSPFWIVDLLWIYPLNSIVIHNRLKQQFEYKAKSICVEISINNEDWILIHKGLVFFGSNKSDNSPFILPLGDKIDARYIKLSLKEKVYFHLSKVEIFVRKKLILEAEKKVIQVPTKNKSNNTIKTIILGTSNSIRGAGYISTLIKNNCDIVANVSLGSSHATMIPYQLDKLENIEANILILDISINEQRAMNLNLYNIELSVEIIKKLLNWCFNKNIIPIITIMPVQNEFTSKIRTHYRKLAQEYSIPFFDGYSFLDIFLKEFKRDEYVSFSDARHLNNYVSQSLGYSLSYSINRLFNRIITPKMNIISKDTDFYDFYYVDLENYVDKEKVIARQTALMTSKFVKLSINDKIEFNVVPNSELVGFMLNMYHCNASLKIIADDKTMIKRLDSNQYQPEKNMVLCSWSMVKPVILNNGKVSLEVIKSVSNINAEKNDHCSHIPIKENEDVVLELVSLIFKGSKKSGKLIYIDGINLNLTKVTIDSPFVDNN